MFARQHTIQISMTLKCVILTKQAYHNEHILHWKFHDSWASVIWTYFLGNNSNRIFVSLVLYYSTSNLKIFFQPFGWVLAFSHVKSNELLIKIQSLDIFESKSIAFIDYILEIISVDCMKNTFCAHSNMNFPSSNENECQANWKWNARVVFSSKFVVRWMHRLHFHWTFFSTLQLKTTCVQYAIKHD